MAKRRQRSRIPAATDIGPLDAAIIVTYGGEAIMGLVECRLASAAQTVQEFTVNVQEVSASISAAGENSHTDRNLARRFFQHFDFQEQPYLRVIGRVLDELLNHRRFESCSGGDVYRTLLEEILEELPPAHRTVRRLPNGSLDVTDSGRRLIDKRLKNLKDGGIRASAATAFPWP